MGNKMCKRKVDSADNSNKKPYTSFNKIFDRLHLRPSTWKSDSYLNEKHVKRSDVNPSQTDKQNNIIKIQPLSKSSDWTEVELEVPEKEQHVHLPNPKLSLIFNNENGTPTPPPRKHKKNLREKLEAVAKSGLQAFQGKKPVEETVCVKKKINYKCPVCDQDEATHNRDHHHHNHNHQQHQNHLKQGGGDRVKNGGKEVRREDGKLDKDKRKKNLSVISLPNYDELKMTVVDFDDTKVPSSIATPEKQKNSTAPATNESKKQTTPSTGKLDNYITRCRSFGSLLPQQLKKLKIRDAPTDVESDDSFGALEDWDLGLIEHYNPKDASLPRPRKDQRSSQEIISDLESLIVQEEDQEPKPPVRRSESLVKKISREGAQSAQEVVVKNATPPPSPEPKQQERLFAQNLATEEDGKVEHSSLMRILEQFSIRDKQEKQSSGDEVTKGDDSLTPSLKEFEKNISSVEDFIKAEKVNTDRDLNIVKTGAAIVS